MQQVFAKTLIANLEGKIKAGELHPILKAFVSVLDEPTDYDLRSVHHVICPAERCFHCLFCTTQFIDGRSGLMGFSPYNMESGGEVWMLLDGRIFYILRPAQRRNPVPESS